MNDLKNVIDYEDQINALESKLEAKNAELRDVATMGTVITSIHEIDAVLSVVMETAIQLVDGEVGVIMLEENEQLTNKISWGINLEFVSTLKYHDNLDIATYTFTNEESIILSAGTCFSSSCIKAGFSSRYLSAFFSKPGLEKYSLLSKTGSKKFQLR